MVAPTLASLSATILTILIVLAIWESIWKAIALWKSGKNNQLAWFIFIFIINSAGILPILYIFFFQKNKRKKLK